MNFAVSDLLFPAFTKQALQQLDKQYGIEFFYEFGKDQYWDEERKSWGTRDLSIHGPCVALNLSDPEQDTFIKVYAETFAYAKKCKAKFVVVHTNEAVVGAPDEAKALILDRIKLLTRLAESYGVQIVVENVGLKPKQNYLFDSAAFLAIFNNVPEAKALIDVGHAHVNGWDLLEIVRLLGPKLIAFHLHDNDGESDQHLPIGQGNIDWSAFFEAVKKYTPEATLVFEYCCGFIENSKLEEHITQVKGMLK